MLLRYLFISFISIFILVNLSCKDSSVAPSAPPLQLYPATKASLHGFWKNSAGNSYTSYFRYDSATARLEFKEADSLNYRHEWWINNFNPADRSNLIWFYFSKYNDSLYQSSDSLLTKYTRYIRATPPDDFDHWVESLTLSDSFPAPGILWASPHHGLSSLIFHNSSWYAVFFRSSLIEHLDLNGQVLDSMLIPGAFALDFSPGLLWVVSHNESDICFVEKRNAADTTLIERYNTLAISGSYVTQIAVGDSVLFLYSIIGHNIVVYDFHGNYLRTLPTGELVQLIMFNQHKLYAGKIGIRYKKSFGYKTPSTKQDSYDTWGDMHAPFFELDQSTGIALHSYYPVWKSNSIVADILIEKEGHFVFGFVPDSTLILYEGSF
ncbi:MAG: hypothetical protein ACHQQQ_01115 [Bacteroidota bacterium]